MLTAFLHDFCFVLFCFQPLHSCQQYCSSSFFFFFWWWKYLENTSLPKPLSTLSLAEQISSRKLYFSRKAGCRYHYLKCISFHVWLQWAKMVLCLPRWRHIHVLGVSGGGPRLLPGNPEGSSNWCASPGPCMLGSRSGALLSFFPGDLEAKESGRGLPPWATRALEHRGRCFLFS